MSNELGSAKMIYQRCEKGCLIWNGDTVKLYEGIKYQTCAANDLFYFFKNKKFQLDYLEFTIEKYQKGNSLIGPYCSFYGKIRKYLKNFSFQNPRTKGKDPVKLNVRKFSMEFFKCAKSKPGAPAVLMCIWPYLGVDSLESIKLRVWDDGHIPGTEKEKFEEDVNSLDKVFKTPQWKRAKELDFDDLEVPVEQFLGFEIIRCKMSQEGLEEFIQILCKSFERAKPTYTIYTGPHFDFQTARETYGNDFIETNSWYDLNEKWKMEFKEFEGNENRIIFQKHVDN